MKKLFSLARFIFAFLIISVAVKAQDVSINVISQEGGTNDGSWTLNATGTTILVTVCNEDFVTFLNTPAYKLRPLISVPGSIVQLAPNASQTGLPAGWSIISNTGSSIRLSNGTDTFAPGECRDIVLNVIPIAIGGPLTVTSTMAFSNGVAPGNAVGSQTPGNDPNNDNSTTAIVITANPPVTTDDMVTGVTPGAPIIVSVLTNDTPGTSAIDITTVELVEPGTGNPVTSVTIPGQGTYTVDVATGVITFTPIPGFSGTPTPVDYTVKDVNGVISNPSTITVTVPLPVTLISFEVRKEGTLAQLNWATTEETNSDRFEIERSVTGKNWNRIGTVVSHGESNTRKNYHFVDASPLNGENLYRLKMVDKDETFAYSSIRSVKFEGAGSDLSIYPNPIVNQLFIRDASQVTQVVINDLNGRTVLLSGSTATGFIDVKGLSAGMYIVRVSRSNGLVSSHKVVVSR